MVRFLGTGASGGTPGLGRSRRRESSLLLSGPGTVLLDATLDVLEQLRGVSRLDAILLTHAHRDASGGVAALRAWCDAHGHPAVPLYADAAALGALRRRHARLDPLRPLAARPGEAFRVGGWRVTCARVPHSIGPRFPTLAWRLDHAGRGVVYASDVSRLVPALRRLAAGASLLVLDGATWRRRIGSHLRIDEDLPRACRWPVRRILLTQVGRSAPPHDALSREVRRLCPKARPAYDGLAVRLSGGDPGYSARLNRSRNRSS